MYSLELLRKYSFWLVDFLKGSPIRKHYNDIKFIIENYNTKASEERRAKHLENLLKNALESTPYYKSNAKGNNLKDFPIIDKDVVRNNYDDFKSAFFTGNKNTPVVTSGSTGTPFKLFHNKNKRLRNNADIIYFTKQGGFEIGSRLIFMKVWNDINRKSPLKLFMENIKPYNILNYTDEDVAQLLTDLNEDNSRKSIFCFASTCDVIVNYLDKINSKPLNFNIKSIITNSDELKTTTKDKMEKYFQVPVLSRYSNMECGMLAQQNYSGGYEFEINWGSYHVELLNIDNDNPAKPGEIGRVVITDLFNYCMPLIRYNTGDLAYMSENKKNTNRGPVLERIEGRKVDLVLDTKNKIITSHIVTVNMWKYSELKQYQFVQTGKKEYKFRLNPWKDFDREEELIKEYKGYFGQDASIAIEYVDEIPLLSSGKRKLVVNEMNSN
ncbi:CoF synthetase [Flaviramulus sp. BrNp1-15]|uniref:CoF synthetase n=1 Tax=Flaviramulus sp. BrNp1-15 TaxID=2916754 RepID=UPI001EE82F9B|nr:CoF synthetase [Flaviramulus sp. BrNp1-15]ULC58289.1 CoF synthetase [Flaviramulus sp. BrNp1-15]